MQPVYVRALRPTVLLALALLGGIIWWATGIWQGLHERSLVTHAQTVADMRLDGFAADFERSLAYVRAVPVVLASNWIGPVFPSASMSLGMEFVGFATPLFELPIVSVRPVAAV